MGDNKAFLMDRRRALTLLGGVGLGALARRPNQVRNLTNLEGLGGQNLVVTLNSGLQGVTRDGKAANDPQQSPLSPPKVCYLWVPDSFHSLSHFCWRPRRITTVCSRRPSLAADRPVR